MQSIHPIVAVGGAVAFGLFKIAAASHVRAQNEIWSADDGQAT